MVVDHNHARKPFSEGTLFTPLDLTVCRLNASHPIWLAVLFGHRE
jgi:hypothetical protein